MSSNCDTPIYVHELNVPPLKKGHVYRTTAHLENCGVVCRLLRAGVTTQLITPVILRGDDWKTNTKMHVSAMRSAIPFPEMYGGWADVTDDEQLCWRHLGRDPDVDMAQHTVVRAMQILLPQLRRSTKNLYEIVAITRSARYFAAHDQPESASRLNAYFTRRERHTGGRQQPGYRYDLVRDLVLPEGAPVAGDASTFATVYRESYARAGGHEALATRSTITFFVRLLYLAMYARECFLRKRPFMADWDQVLKQLQSGPRRARKQAFLDKLHS